MPIPNDYRDIVSVLAEKTEQGALSWVDDTLFVTVEVDKSKFRLWTGVDELTEESFVAFGLYDKNSKVVDSWYLDESEPDYQSVHRLYRAAKRHAAGVPDLLKSLVAKISAMDKK
jgi:hypothetical protein